MCADIFLGDVVPILADTGIDIVTVIGFPYGYSSLISKFEEAEDALAKGADHLDMVINIAAVKIMIGIQLKMKLRPSRNWCMQKIK